MENMQFSEKRLIIKWTLHYRAWVHIKDTTIKHDNTDKDPRLKTQQPKSQKLSELRNICQQAHVSCVNVSVQTD